MTEANVVLYVADDCGLCDEARALLRGEGIAFQEATDPRYILRVPVVVIEGSIAAEGRIRPLALRRALRRARHA